MKSSRNKLLIQPRKEVDEYNGYGIMPWEVDNKNII